MVNKVFEVISETQENGGFTWEITGRYVVGLKNKGAVKFKTTETNEIEDAIQKKIESGKNFGTWIDECVFYIDEVVCVNCKAIALQIGLINDQISIYDTQSDITINLSEVL